MVDQVGGTHYQSEYQHWDWVTDIGLPYLPACATKYVARWRKKGGRQDLMKARSYVEKMLVVGGQRAPAETAASERLTDFFISTNRIEKREALVIRYLTMQSDDIFRSAIEVLDEIIASAPEDTETAAMQHYSGTGHPAPFGYDGNG